MNQKGFAASGVLYTILIIGLVSMISLLYDLQNKKTVLDKLKFEVVEATDSSCSDPGFALNVVAFSASSALPSSSIENQIAVITSSAISNSYLSDTAPTTPVEGDIWISFDVFTNTSIVSGKLKLPISYVAQYVSGTWVFKEAYIYKATAWVEINTFSASTQGTYNFAYTGAVQTLVVPYTGYYLLQTWGAQGGGGSFGGNGGYTTGVYHVTAGTTLYVYVGQQALTYSTVGYNGGGYGGGIGYGGGGATHIATSTGLLSALSSNKTAILAVAGGGGGAIPAYSGVNYVGGAGGGASGLTGTVISGYATAVAGTQTAGFAFGLGGLSAYSNSCSQGGGGGGYYGGYSSCGSGGAGGSGYISSSLITYGGYTAAVIAGNATIPSVAGLTEVGHTGNGYARITLIKLG